MTKMHTNFPFSYDRTMNFAPNGCSFFCWLQACCGDVQAAIHQTINWMYAKPIAIGETSNPSTGSLISSCSASVSGAAAADGAPIGNTYRKAETNEAIPLGSTEMDDMLFGGFFDDGSESEENGGLEASAEGKDTGKCNTSHPI